MTSPRILNMVYTECVDADEAKFNKWYNEVHVPMLFKNPGLKKVTRYQRVGDNQEQAQYLAIYEFDTTEEQKAFLDSKEFKAAGADVEETWHGGGFEIKGVAVYEPIKTWEK